MCYGHTYTHTHTANTTCGGDSGSGAQVFSGDFSTIMATNALPLCSVNWQFNFMPNNFHFCHNDLTWMPVILLAFIKA